MQEYPGKIAKIYSVALQKCIGLHPYLFSFPFEIFWCLGNVKYIVSWTVELCIIPDFFCKFIRKIIYIKRNLY